ncbi:hypothetical protein PPL_06737 [Heterostelium album PN500]|uniref:Uncharacterized protein n=1 Tax=Heterostelium pallidum (strain ATCC 26659 / Pp 5 / PN500) TaxID=670386 RepID=D3BFK3_HETP5|nr:hypothetical protein PPL_06737 [Heterostelium album PN500]
MCFSKVILCLSLWMHDYIICVTQKLH